MRTQKRHGFFDPERKMEFYTFSRDEIHAVLHREGNVICILAFLALVGFQKIVVNDMISGLVPRGVRLLSDKRFIGYELPLPPRFRTCT